MKTATCIHNVRTRPESVRAFTLIELLVVIAIIAILAGLIVGLNNVASSSKNISRTKAENERLVTLIHSYKAKVGVYPPDNINNPAANTLLYELAGAIRDVNINVNPGNANYITPFGNVRANVLTANLGASGIQNAVDIYGETNQVHRILKELRPDQVATIGGTLSLVIPVDDPNRQRPNRWRYLVGENANHNKDSFDLWVEIYARGRTNNICTNCLIIGNWKE